MDRVIGALALITMLVGVHVEQLLWDGRSMETPSENTVTAFEIEEEGLSVVLTNAIEDAREVVEHLVSQHDDAQAAFNRGVVDGVSWGRWDVLKQAVEESSEMQFRAMRVLGLLEAAREREAGGVA